MKQKFIFTTVLVTLLTLSGAYSSDRKDISYTSDKVEAILKQNRIDHFSETISVSDQNNFPANTYIPLIQNFTSSEDITLVFTAQDGLYYIDQIIEFCRKISSSKFNKNLSVLILADEADPNLKKTLGFTSAEPFRHWIETNDISEKSSVIILGKNPTAAQNHIIPGNESNRASAHLVKSAVNSFTRIGKKASIPMTFLSLYKTGIIDVSENLKAIAETEADSCHINLSPQLSSQETVSFLTDLCQTLDSQQTPEKDTHYQMIRIGTWTFFIGEKFYALSFFIFALLLGGYLCFSNFMPTLKNGRITSNIKRHFGIPIFLMASVFAIVNLIDLPFKDIQTLPQFQIVLKVFASFSFFLLFFVILQKMKVSLLPASLSFYELLFSILDIFLWGFWDISLGYLFFAISFFSTIFNRARKTKNLFVSFGLMIIPCIPYIAVILNIFRNASYMYIQTNSVYMNLLLSTFLITFYFHIQRILKSFTEDWTSTEKKKHLAMFQLSISLILIGFSGIALFLSSLIPNAMFKTKPKSTQPILKAEEPLVKLQMEETTFQELNQTYIKIFEPQNVLFQSLVIEAPDTAPVYDCNYSFETRGKNASSIIIPDYPSGTLDLTVSMDKTQDKKLILQTVYIRQDNKIYLEKQEIEIPGTQQ